MLNNISSIKVNNIYANSVSSMKQKNACDVPFRGTTITFPDTKTTVTLAEMTNAIRTKMDANEQKMYAKVLSSLPRNQRPQLDILLKTGVLLNSKSNDNTTVLTNLHKIITEKRAPGLDKKVVLSELVNTLINPFVITQKFGDIPVEELTDILKNPDSYKAQDNSNGEKYTSEIQNVHSSACVAASIEFDLASKQPAEFARIANGLTSENISAQKKLKVTSIAPNLVETLWFLNEFKADYKLDNWDNVLVTMKPDRNAIVRARIQMTHKDPNERSLIDVLMQSTFMNIGSQKTYNSLTDIRTGKYNPDNTGLTDIEKSFAESIATGKNKLSLTYQNIDDAGMITSYECDFPTMKRHITDALNMGENVIVGYTQQDSTGKVINGHEITIVSLEKDINGKEVFVCNDTDDESDMPVKYYVDEFLPSIHHAGLPKQVVKNDVDLRPVWYDVMDDYKKAG